MIGNISRRVLRRCSVVSLAQIKSRRAPCILSIARLSTTPEASEILDPSEIDAEVMRGLAEEAKARGVKAPASIQELKHRHIFLSHRVNFFQRGGLSNVYSHPEGTYVEVARADIERYMPEGVAKSVQQEFDFTQRNEWMIRDVTKVIFRLIDDFENRFCASSVAPEVSCSSPPCVPGITNLGTSWPNTTPAIYMNSKENLLPKNFYPYTEDGDHINYGEGSLSETMLQLIKNKCGESFPERIMLTGERGCGKSTIMSQAVMYARQKGWIVFNVPNGYEQANGGTFIDTVTLAQDDHYRELYDNPYKSLEILRNFYHAHLDDLKNIPIKFPHRLDKYKQTMDEYKQNFNDYVTKNGARGSYTELRALVLGEVFPKEDALDEPILRGFDINDFEVSTLADLVKMAVAHHYFAGLVVIDLVAELKALNIPGKPVLIAVDEMNYWEHETVYTYHGRKIKPLEICVPHALKFTTMKPQEHDRFQPLANGFYLGSGSYERKKTVNYDDHAEKMPLLINVPSYSDVEFVSMCKNYQFSHQIQETASDNDLATYRSFVGNNPYFARKECTPFFLPLASNVVTQYVRNLDQSIIERTGGQPTNEPSKYSSYQHEEREAALQRQKKREATPVFDEPGPFGIMQLLEVKEYFEAHKQYHEMVEDAENSVLGIGSTKDMSENEDDVVNVDDDLLPPRSKK